MDWIIWFVLWGFFGVVDVNVLGGFVWIFEVVLLVVVMVVCGIMIEMLESVV